MIKNIEVTADDAGFPIVKWIETRGHLAPRGPGQLPVECRIMKDGATGELLFVAKGAKRQGSFEHGRPWQALRGISLHAAAAIYNSAVEQIVFGHMAQKGLGSKLAWTDAGQVFTAEFRGDEPVHINYADASRDDLERLHLALTKAFFGREQLVAHLCDVNYRWPVNDPRVETYDPGGKRHVSLFLNLLAGATVIGIILCVAVLVLWLSQGLPSFSR